MRELVYSIIIWVAKVHDHILQINDSGGYYFDDKQLHFLVLGAFGMLLIFLIHPVFRLLAKHDHIMVITWIYVFTLVLVVTFAIEIGQWYSGTGSMESADIAYGVAGFLVMFFIFAVLRELWHAVRRMVKKDNRATKVYSSKDFYGK